MPDLGAFRLPKTQYRKAIELPALRERSEVGHVLINLEGYFYNETPLISFPPGPWTVNIMVERDDDPLPNEDEREYKPHPGGWKFIELFRGIARDSGEALDHDAYQEDDEDDIRWSSGEHTHHVLITYHYAETPVPDPDRRSMTAHSDYEFRTVPTIDGPVIVHIESWFKTEP